MIDNKHTNNQANFRFSRVLEKAKEQWKRVVYVPLFLEFVCLLRERGGGGGEEERGRENPKKASHC